MERNLTRERTRSALAVKKANGERVGSIPYGYDLAPDGHTLIPNEAEQGVIAEIRAMRSGGMKLQKIASTLTGMAVPTKTRKSGSWSHQAVARIITRICHDPG
jgi:DNA invertase Pin-like site-specific DNA recombinase